MTTTSSTLIARLNGVNEAVIGHEDDEYSLNGALLDVSEQVRLLVQTVHEHAGAIVQAIGDDAAKRVIRAILWANDKSQNYTMSLHMSGITHVHQGLDMLRAASRAVDSVMDHIDPIMEVLDK